MKYDFDKVIERRGTNCSKWDRNEELFGKKDIIDMWVADMDFPSPQPVVEAIKKRADHPIFGYTFAPDSLYEIIMERFERYYNWKIKKEWIVLVPGVVDGVNAAIKGLTHPGDEVILQPPVYYPFYSGIANNGCQVRYNPLKFDGNKYVMDYEDLESHFQPKTTFPARDPRVGALILCSPHNPVGRVWTKEELKQLGEICLKYNCPIISDEIHCDLLMDDYKHTVTATISPELAQHTITFMAASKTFNLAGVKASVAIIPNADWRKRFNDARKGQGGVGIFGFEALEAAYRHGDDYLKQLLDYLQGNLDYFCEFIENRIPKLKVVRPEGTYLLWLDMRGLGMDQEELNDFMIQKAGIAVDFGNAFGPGGEGFQRFNLACPRSILEKALNNLEKAINEL